MALGEPRDVKPLSTRLREDRLGGHHPRKDALPIGVSSLP
jgi:hypothetical protein